jgi:class 3 adenylate cyclase
MPFSEPDLAQSAFTRFRGRELEAPAGRIRASFDGPARAVRCASALAGVIPSLRAGVHTGECELLENGGLTGAALEVAAGVAGAASPGQILATSTVQDLVAGSGIEFTERGTVTLEDNGAPHDWRVFAVLS